MTQSSDKAARVAVLSVPVETGGMRLKGLNAVDESQRELFEEMIAFPFGEHDDLVDAAAMGTVVGVQPVSPGRIGTQNPSPSPSQLREGVPSSP